MKMLEEAPTYFCTDCNMPVWVIDDHCESVMSHCTCTQNMVQCDLCGFKNKPKDMSVMNMFASLCKGCNSDELFEMDYLSIGNIYRGKQEIPLMCVEQFEDRLQISMHWQSKGLAVRFPSMTKREIITRWMAALMHNASTEISLLFECAVLRLQGEYISDQEFRLLVSQWQRTGPVYESVEANWT